ncbi:MAG: hypothetical protein ACMXYB_04875 [Candidatus Woesearchaeota archaeon]
MEFEQEQIVFSTVMSILIVLSFIWAFNSQGKLDINSFENCITEDSCLYELIKVSNQTNLCNRAHNPNTCFISNAIFFDDPNLCAKTNQELKCIVSLGIELNKNYCGFFEEKNTFQECLLNLELFKVLE